MIKAENLAPLFLWDNSFFRFGFEIIFFIDKFNKYHNSIRKATPQLYQLFSIQMISIN